MNKAVFAGLALAVIAAMPAAATAPIVAIDGANTPPAFNQVYASTGPTAQRDGRFQRVRGYLSQQRELLKSNGPGTDRLIFTPSLPQAGYYRVYAWWPLDEQAGTALISVHDQQGLHKQLVTQQRNGGQWREIGSYQFAAGNVRIEFAEQQGSLLVDALRIEYVGSQPPSLQLAQDKLPLIETGVAYAARIYVSGGTAPYQFSVHSGTLPRGLRLDARTGEIRGRVDQTGHHDVIVGFVDSRGRGGSGHLKLDVIDGDPVVLDAATLASQHDGRSPVLNKAASKDAAVTAAADLSGLLSALAATPDGEWLRANLNRYSDVWAPAALRPLDNLGNPDPSKIIGAWSGYAWDPNRGELWLYGGGHANYSGNDVYRWRGSSRMWERASLPSEVTKDIRGNFVAIDGPDNAPASAHTYDNNIFLPLHDRMLVFGGAAYNNGGMFMRAVDALTSRRTGPYLFDPARADPNKVGGSTGSHVKRVGPYPEIGGGNMWQNRDMFLNIASTPKLPGSHTEGCTAYAEEGGRDVVYAGVRNGGGTATTLYRYVINDLANPTLDSWQQVGGYWDAPQGQTACAYDPQQKLFVRTGAGTTRSFMFWDLNTPGANNYEKPVAPVDPTGQFQAAVTSGAIALRDCGFDFDANSRRYALWCSGNQLWWLTPPATVSSSGWTIAKIPTPIGAAPPFGAGTGVLGKWKYIPNLNAFMALQDSSQGNIWIYKPVGWTPPAGDDNLRPTVSLTSPSNGQEFIAGATIALAASASDLDGSIARVEFYDGSTLLGTDTVAPYQYAWTNPAIGTRNLTARAYDNDDGQTISAIVSITVLPGVGGTVELQEGLGGYAGTRDTYLSTYSKSSNYGSSTLMYDETSSYTQLVRFAIFQREGGPVPDGAVIQSARLKLYKYSGYSPLYGVFRMLRNWEEKQASWNGPRTGESWTVLGAGSAGSDYHATADNQVQAPWSAGWLDFDVTASLQAMQSGASNHGWRLRRLGGDSANLKKFYTREASADTSKRPMLVVTYSAP